MLMPPPGDGAGALASGAGSSAAAATDAVDAAELPDAMPLHGGQQPQPSPQPQPQVSYDQVADRVRHDHAVVHAKMLSIHAEYVAQGLDLKHGIKFLVDVQRKDENKQQLKGRCMACGKVITSTGSNRVVQHIVKCALVPMEISKAYKKLKERSDSTALGKRQAEVNAGEEAEVWAKKRAAAQAVFKQTGIKASLQGTEQAWADKCIAEFFYANAIPFNVASNEPGGLYRRMVAAIKATPAGYRPPNFNKLGGELLQTCYAGMWKDVKDRDPDGTLAYKYGTTYVTDGWDSCDRLSLINSAFISNNDGGLFWRSVDTSGHVKNAAQYTVSLMIADIYNFGPLKVVMVVTDTCAVMRKAWDIVQCEFPWISCLPCQPHVISLLLKDIGKTAEVRLPSACARFCYSSSPRSQSCT